MKDKNFGASAGAETGSRASVKPASGLDPSGFDPARDVPSAICGCPLPGWQLDFVRWDEGREGLPDGWIVKLKLEGLSWRLGRREYSAMARSDVGPLEAWDEALRIALRSDAREVQRGRKAMRPKPTGVTQ